MNKKEKQYLLYYLDQLSLKLRNNMAEVQQNTDLAVLKRRVTK